MADLVVGLGNRLRGDDGAGLVAARLVASHFGDAPGLTVVEHESEPSDLLEMFGGVTAAVVIDAFAGERPGLVHRFDAANEPLPAIFRAPASTHTLDLAEVIELGRELDRLPGRFEVIAIEASEFELGEPVAAAVAAGAELAALVTGGLLLSRRFAPAGGGGVGTGPRRSLAPAGPNRGSSRAAA